MNTEKNTIYLLSKLSQKENKLLRNAYEREIKHLRDDIEKENKSLRNEYEKKIRSLNGECELEIKYLNHEYEQEIKSLNEKYEQEIKSKDIYNQWVSELFCWDLQTIIVASIITLFLYLITIFYSKNSPFITLCIFGFSYLLLISFSLITISLDRKISIHLYLKAKIIYFLSYFHSRH
ncbi:hypothetical protein J8V57_14655 [Xenorhabdus sp. PB61.4]|uniref:MICOS complex subunit MIC60 n=1 Tax=Xenorhabdus sp. PB61.4 TaxID=2788940 RepID=UPI001E5F3936|nr:MICOS complex subunit MIC60 [Xenorhabdus sp. PB61.4]MCC8367496.1 hypothetical protein [Xenorhabdus sp. PB61.4]